MYIAGINQCVPLFSLTLEELKTVSNSSFTWRLNVKYYLEIKERTDGMVINKHEAAKLFQMSRAKGRLIHSVGYFLLWRDFREM